MSATSDGKGTPIEMRLPGRVAVLIGSFSAGGAERAMIQFANGLSGRGISVDLLVCRDCGQLRKLVSDEVRTIVLGAGAASSVLKVRKYFRRHQPDVALSSQAHVSAAAIVASRRLGRRPIMIIREGSTPTEDVKSISSPAVRCYRGLTKRLARFADLFVAVSHESARDCVAYYGVDPSRVAVIYTPIVDDTFHERAAESVDHHWFTESRRVVVSVGRVMPVKDFETLIRAFAIVRGKVDCRLLIVGDTHRDIKYYRHLCKLKQQQGVAEFVELVGYKQNPLPYVRRSEVYVQSSRYEGLPASLVQALTLGCKLVSTRCRSGPSEILDEGRLGQLVPVGDVAAMATAIEYQLNQHDCDRRQQVDWSSQFTERRAIDTLLSSIQRLLSGSRPPLERDRSDGHIQDAEVRT